MRTWPLIVSLAALLSLGACVSAEERERMAAEQRIADEQECTQLGFERGTEKYSECLLKLREIRAEERRAQAIEQANRHPFFYDPWYYGRPYPHRYW